MHYRGLTKIIINLNWLFDERQKDGLLDKLSTFLLKPNIKTLLIEDSMLNYRNLDSITRTQFAQKIVALKLPRNNIGDQGVNFIFSSSRLAHIIKLDLSSNLITKTGAEMIA